MKRLPKIPRFPNIEENSKVKLPVEEGLKKAWKKISKGGWNGLFIAEIQKKRNFGSMGGFGCSNPRGAHPGHPVQRPEERDGAKCPCLAHARPPITARRVAAGFMAGVHRPRFAPGPCTRQRVRVPANGCAPRVLARSTVRRARRDWRLDSRAAAPPMGARHMALPHRPLVPVHTKWEVDRPTRKFGPPGPFCPQIVDFQCFRVLNPFLASV